MAITYFQTLELCSIQYRLLYKCKIGRGMFSQTAKKSKPSLKRFETSCPDGDFEPCMLKHLAYLELLFIFWALSYLVPLLGRD